MVDKIKILLFYYLYSRLRVLKYRALSLNDCVSGSPRLWQPLLSKGKGQILFNKNVTIGVRYSSSFFSTYAYIEERQSSAKISIGDNVCINNNASIICERETVEIGNNTLIGLNFQISDSDFHNLDPQLRTSGIPTTASIKIGTNVFIGSNVTVLKGVNNGDNSVIANGSIVTKSIPQNVIAGGIPCKVIKPIC